MLGNVRVVESAVADLVLRVDNVTVEVVNGTTEFVSNNDLALTLLGLLDEIDHDDGRPVPSEQIGKVSLGGVVGRIDAIEDNGWFGQRYGRLLSPIRWDRTSNLQDTTKRRRS